MTMEWNFGLSLSCHKMMCSQVCIDICYMEEAFVNCYNTDNAEKKTAYAYRKYERSTIEF